MKRAKLLLFIPLLFVAVLLFLSAATSADDDEESTNYRLVTTINPPALTGFDISWVDSESGRYYLADRGAGGVDVIDTQRDTFLYTLGVGVFAGTQPVRRTSGPDGITVIHKGNEFFGEDDDRGRSELWAGDGVPPGKKSTVKVFDLASKSLVANISTGGNHRADELAYDPADQIILIANDADTPAPFVSFISASGHPSDYHVLGKIFYDGSNGNPNSTGGIEQPVWDAQRHRFYICIPSTVANPNGEVDEIDPRTETITRVFPIPNADVAFAGPAGLALLPGQRLITSTGVVFSAKTGAILAEIAGVSGDEIWYNPGDNRVYFGATPMPVVDAESLTVVATINDGGTHSVAADSENNRIFVPSNAIGTGTPPGTGVQVFTEEEERERHDSR
jgi:DNA-binding beta-propeller fold protein YncE